MGYLEEYFLMLLGIFLFLFFKSDFSIVLWSENILCKISVL